MIKYFLGTDSAVLVSIFGIAFAFLLTALALSKWTGFLPRDLGRDFAFNGKKSQGKPRGAGILFVSIFFVASLLFARLQTDAGISIEIISYLVLIMLAMLSGYLDDRSNKPWSEYLKGFLDLLIAVSVAVTYLYANDNTVYLLVVGKDLEINKWVFGALIVLLVWVSINVTNCTDGVDGLSGTLSVITLSCIYLIDYLNQSTDLFSYLNLLFVACLMAYLWFNASPSRLMMGDAGSRAMGLMIAISVLKSGSAFLYIPIALVLILDGGLGLLKVSLLRFLKIKILKNIRTPLHDHFRKNKGWSDTQVVMRFSIIQIAICAAVICFLVWSKQR
ncbi:MAG: phospho-N-acetylmuramoyl-pentapeptide-transferase [Ruminococcaceae bacterium]|nr:phospho-N-acetylmuramoyl-pentapeptide-transferase [Oscillospiraceae bacterium]